MGGLPLMSVVLNVAIALGSPAAWAQIALGRGGSLADTGTRSLKYFTVLSNLFSGLVSLAYVVAGLGGAVPTWLVLAKVMATTAVMVTFLTTVTILTPVYGWKAMYAGGNLWLHLVLPLFALVDCCLWLPMGKLSLPSTAWAMLPVLPYGIWYLRRVLACEDGEELKRRDFYGFCRWGRDKVGVVFAVMLLLSWGIGAAIWALARLL